LQVSGCPDCNVPGESGAYRCDECFFDELVCKGCCLRRHSRLPFHRIKVSSNTLLVVSRSSCLVLFRNGQACASNRLAWLIWDCESNSITHLASKMYAHSLNLALPISSSSTLMVSIRSTLSSVDVQRHAVSTINFFGGGFSPLLYSNLKRAPRFNFCITSISNPSSRKFLRFTFIKH
jgi:hypothetical protein